MSFTEKIKRIKEMKEKNELEDFSLRKLMPL